MAQRRNKVAVVEDNPDNRLLVRAMLKQHYDLLEFGTAAAALAAFAKMKPDLILLDISLPETDGVQLLGHIRADARLCDVPVVALTAHAMAGDREEYLRLGFDGYVAKPITDVDAFRLTIETHIRARQ